MTPDPSEPNAAKDISGPMQVIVGGVLGALPYLFAWLWYSSKKFYGTGGVATKFLFSVISFFPLIAIAVVAQSIMAAYLMRNGYKIAAYAIWMICPILIFIIFARAIFLEL